MKSIAIDGPSGAGKSTIARAVAEKLGFIYADTGALYRAIALYMMENSIDIEKSEDVISALPKISVEIKFINGEQRIFLNETDVSEKIRKNEVSMSASSVSGIPAVREYLLGLQRNLADKNDIIMDGRDIGTVVLPNADIKIFLTASPEERAKRRQKQLLDKGEVLDFNTILAEINQRDYNDMNRETAPLKKADDAVIVDTTENELEESILMLADIIKEKLGI